MHHKKLTQIMADFADGLDRDLKFIKQTMSNHTRATDSYFEGVKSHADQLKIKLQASMDSMSKDLKVSLLFTFEACSLTLL